MEPRIEEPEDPIDKRIEELKIAIESASFDDQLRNTLNDELKKLTDAYEELRCPVSECYFSTTNPPFKIMTTDPNIILIRDPDDKSKIIDKTIRTIVDKTTKENLERRGIKVDPKNRFKITGYVKDEALLERVREQENILRNLEVKTMEQMLNHIEEKVKEYGQTLDEQEQMINNLEEELEEIHKEASSLIQSKDASSLFQSPSTKFYQSNIKQQPNKKETESKILLYRAEKDKKDMLAVEFPDEATANKFLELIEGSQKYIGDRKEFKDKIYPLQIKNENTILYFPAYKAQNGEFTGIFPTKEMRTAFYNILISDGSKKNTDTHPKKINYLNENVIYFQNKIFFKEKGNVSLPVPDQLKQNLSPSKGKQ